ncbi:MAG: PilZ domain-containing protein [Pseudomonadota bacterium]
MSQGHEKRESFRVPLDTVVSFTLDGKTWTESRSRDVSAAGMLLRTVEPVPPGRDIVIRFKLPNLEWQDDIEVKARVARAVKRQGRQIGLGLQFQTLRAGHYQVVHEFVQRILGLPVNDLTDWGAQTSGGGYSVSMERLAKQALDLRTAEQEKKANASRSAARLEFLFRQVSRAAKATIALATGYVFFELTSTLMSLAEKIGR